MMGALIAVTTSVVLLALCLRIENYGRWLVQLFLFLLPATGIALIGGLLTGTDDAVSLGYTVAIAIGSIVFVTLGRPARALPDGCLPPADETERDRRDRLRRRGARLV